VEALEMAATSTLNEVIDFDASNVVNGALDNLEVYESGKTCGPDGTHAANGHGSDGQQSPGPENNGHADKGVNGSNGSDRSGGIADLYELLQISPFAGSETIHRIYRFLAARYHPDNPSTGNADMFHKVKTAYDVLSNPERRAKYDALRSGELRAATPLSSTLDFMDDIEGEINRRLALLAVLYARRRTSPHYPEVTLSEVESYMGFPRDYLDFTTWYLVKKGYVQKADNSDFTLTVSGVDYVESQRAQVPILNRLLTSGHIRTTVATDERRYSGIERRQNLPDTRAIKTERRANKRDRRMSTLEVHGFEPGLTVID
jgi:curved DNA-binding protein